jgi:hypothetical protein
MFKRYNAILILGCITNAFKPNTKIEKEKKVLRMGDPLMFSQFML